jgi:uncharacterized protein YggT (Ycf19 family)
MIEKVFLPFEAEVWWWLVGTMSALVVISVMILKFPSNAIKNYVFGSKVNTPLLNML